MAQSGSLGVGELAKKGQGTWYILLSWRQYSLYPLIHGGGGSGGDVGVGGGYLRPLREGRGEVSET